MLRHMKGHYWARMHVCKARMKILKRRLREALRRRKRPNPLRILAEASLTGQDTLWRTSTPNLSKFGENFVIFKFLGQKTGFSVKWVSPSYAHFFLGHLLEKIFAFLDFSWLIMHPQTLPKHFIKIWMVKELKNTMKTNLLPPFAPAGSTSRRNEFLEGKMSSKLGNSTWFG